MAGGTRGVDFITIDGGEGGTGAGPLVFTDHVALPFKVGFSRVQKIFTEHGLHQRILFIGSGKLGFPEAAVFAFALGCDAINVGREAMMAIGCIQAQRCHTNHCPTGVATHHPWLVRGVDPTSKAARLANYIITLRKDVLALSRACGVPHPALITADQLELLDDRFGAKTIAELFGYGRGFGLPSPTDCEEVRRLMKRRTRNEVSGPPDFNLTTTMTANDPLGTVHRMFAAFHIGDARDRTVQNRMQRVQIRGRFKIDEAGRYSVRAGVFTGRRSTADPGGAVEGHRAAVRQHGPGTRAVHRDHDVRQRRLCHRRTRERATSA